MVKRTTFKIKKSGRPVSSLKKGDVLFGEGKKGRFIVTRKRKIGTIDIKSVKSDRTLTNLGQAQFRGLKVKRK